MESSNQNIKLDNRGGKMNIIFMRHGNATDNVKEIISDKEIYWSTLTEDGRKTVLESIETLPSKIDNIQFHKSTRLQIL